MGEYDDLLPDERGIEVARTSAAPRLPKLSRQRAIQAKDPGVLRTVGKTREEWVELGRRLGEHEADRRGEDGDGRRERIARAMMYTAWEYDGKPAGYGDRYEKEFGLKPVGLNNQVAHRGADFKREQRSK